MPGGPGDSGDPRVSVVLAVRDGAATVGAAVDSVLRQTLRDLELVVVDDGSTDETRAIVEQRRDPRLRLVALERGEGRSAALNAGIAAARGPLVARLDADDLALPSRLERQLAALSRNQDVAVLGTAAFELRDGRVGGVLAPLRSPLGVRWWTLLASPFLHPTVVLDRQRFVRAGLRYDTALEEAEDHDLWARALDRFEGANLAEPLTLYRVHAAQASLANREVQQTVQQRVSLRTVRAWLPDLALTDAEWERVRAAGAAGWSADPDALHGLLDAAALFLDGLRLDGGREVRATVSRTILRSARHLRGPVRRSLLARAARLDRGALAGAPGVVLRRVRTPPARRAAQRAVTG